jgi:hypothetical protein
MSKPIWKNHVPLKMSMVHLATAMRMLPAHITSRNISSTKHNSYPQLRTESTYKPLESLRILRVGFEDPESVETLARELRRRK